MKGHLVFTLKQKKTIGFTISICTNFKIKRCGMIDNKRKIKLPTRVSLVTL